MIDQNGRHEEKTPVNSAFVIPLCLGVFGLGTTEFIVLLVAAIFLFGPTQFPKLGRAIGKSIGSLKKSDKDR